MLSDLVTAWVRTVVPTATAAGLAALAAKLGIPGPVPDLGPWAVAVVLAVLYLAVAALERRWPKLGWLLGVPRRPSYTPPEPVTSGPRTVPPYAGP